MTQTPPETPDPTTAEAGDTAEGERIVVLTPEGLGRIRSALGEFDAARAALREALRLDPAAEARVRKWLAEVDAAERAQPR